MLLFPEAAAAAQLRGGPLHGAQAAARMDEPPPPPPYDGVVSLRLAAAGPPGLQRFCCSRELSDCELVAACGARFPAHRIILEAWSEPLRAILGGGGGGWAPAGGAVAAPAAAADVEALLRLMYGCALSHVRLERLPPLYALSDYFGVAPAADACVEALRGIAVRLAGPRFLQLAQCMDLARVALDAGASGAGPLAAAAAREVEAAACRPRIAAALWAELKGLLRESCADGADSCARWPEAAPAGAPRALARACLRRVLSSLPQLLLCAEDLALLDAEDMAALLRINGGVTAPQGVWGLPRAGSAGAVFLSRYGSGPAAAAGALSRHSSGAAIDSHILAAIAAGDVGGGGDDEAAAAAGLPAAQRHTQFTLLKALLMWAASPAAPAERAGRAAQLDELLCGLDLSRLHPTSIALACAHPFAAASAKLSAEAARRGLALAFAPPPAGAEED